MVRRCGRLENYLFSLQRIKQNRNIFMKRKRISNSLHTYGVYFKNIELFKYLIHWSYCGIDIVKKVFYCFIQETAS